MRKLAERVRDWTHGQDERLRLRLEALPQRTKLAIVLVIFAFFAAVSYTHLTLPTILRV